MKKQYLYSIVVPIYNVEKYLKECVDSLINQSYKNIEIILVDDGSPDNSPKICDDYAKIDKRIKVLHKKNGGLVSARKAGAEIAEGDYVICVDGDDYIVLDMVEKINDIILKYDCDLVCCGHFIGDKNKIYSYNFETGYYDKTKIREVIFNQLIENGSANCFSNSIWAKVYKRELYLKEQLAVRDEIKIGEDLACTKPIIAKAKDLYILNEPLCFYRTNNNSMTKNRKPFRWDGPELIYNHLQERLKDVDYDFNEQLNRNCVHNFFNVAVSQFYDKDKKYKEIKKIIIDKMKNVPVFNNSLKIAKYDKSFRGKLMLFTLRHKMFCLLKLYSLVK